MLVLIFVSFAAGLLCGYLYSSHPVLHWLLVAASLLGLFVFGGSISPPSLLPDVWMVVRIVLTLGPFAIGVGSGERAWRWAWLDSTTIPDTPSSP